MNYLQVSDASKSQFGVEIWSSLVLRNIVYNSESACRDKLEYDSDRTAFQHPKYPFLGNCKHEYPGNRARPNSIARDVQHLAKEYVFNQGDIGSNGDNLKQATFIDKLKHPE